MKLIQDNPFRIAGILANASERELIRQKTKINRYVSIGKKVDSEYDFSFLNKVDRSENSLNKAFSGIEQSQDKVSKALFWFLKANTFDETAFNYLINGDKEKAIQIWEKVTEGKDVTPKNYSCFNNFGTLKLLGNANEEIKEGIAVKVKLIESESFIDFVHAVADQTYTIDNQKQAEKFVDDLLVQFKGKYSSVDTLKLFSNCNGTTLKYLSQKFTEEPLYKIETQIESTKNKRKINKNGAYELGLKLIMNCKDDLATLKSLLGISDLKYKMIADNLAKEVMQCGIDYFNESVEYDSKGDYLKHAKELNQKALSIAVGRLIQDRAKEQIKTLDEINDREVTQAVEFLQSVKTAYETNEANIRRQIKELEATDLQIRTGLKSINHSVVDNNIRNSIDWDKVNDLLKQILADKNLTKIKESNKTEVKNKYWELANWLKKHSQKNSIILSIIDKYKSIPPNLCFKVLSTDIINTDSNSNVIRKPFYVEDIRYVGLKLNISSTCYQMVTIFIKYINPEGKYSQSSISSSEGYTSSNVITIRPETKAINLGGWGNEKECTYQVGEHKIEIYIEHYKIYSKSFKVDWSPNEKFELTKNLELLENELMEVESFQWFRSSETKQRQVKEIQIKVNKARNTLMNK